MRKCWVCGKPATEFPTCRTEKYVPDIWEGVKGTEASHRAFCGECAKIWLSENSAAKKQYIALRKKLMLERAIKILEGQDIVIDDYKEAIEAVDEFVRENTDRFDSADEMVAAIILIDNELPIKVQARIGRYEADFIIPSLKVVLEIDGERHARSVYYDNNRDLDIRTELGPEWEVVRIKTEYIEQNAELLVEAIKSIKASKQAVRAQNGGELPDWYHKREKRPRKQNYGDELLL